jgi:hypothetical protein
MMFVTLLAMRECEVVGTQLLQVYYMPIQHYKIPFFFDFHLGVAVFEAN